MRYDNHGNEIVESPGMISIRVERGGERIDTEVPEGATIQALIEEGHLRGVQTTTRVNGAPASQDTALQQGDTVCQIPKSGEQG